MKNIIKNEWIIMREYERKGCVCLLGKDEKRTGVTASAGLVCKDNKGSGCDTRMKGKWRTAWTREDGGGVGRPGCALHCVCVCASQPAAGLDWLYAHVYKHTPCPLFPSRSLLPFNHFPCCCCRPITCRPSRIITLSYRISLFRNDSGLSASLPLPHSHNHRKAVK